MRFVVYHYNRHFASTGWHEKKNATNLRCIYDIVEIMCYIVIKTYPFVGFLLAFCWLDIKISRLLFIHSKFHT